jgi:hypothetical protein
VQVSRIGGALVTGLLVLALPSWSAATDPPQSAVEPAVCSAMGDLPPNVRLSRDIHKRVKIMLQRSPTFRAQCQRLAEAPWVHVLVRYTVQFDSSTYRARSTFRRPQPELLIAMVDLSATADPAMWLAHEFEHLLEQMDGVDMAKLTADPLQAWEVRTQMFETRRAIRAGQAVSDEVHVKRQHDKFVD